MIQNVEIQNVDEKKIIIIPLGINLSIFLFEKIKQLNEEVTSINSVHSSDSVNSWINIKIEECK